MKKFSYPLIDNLQSLCTSLILTPPSLCRKTNLTLLYQRKKLSSQLVITIALGLQFIFSEIPFSSSGQAGEWTWMKGDMGNSLNAVFGTLGVAAPANTPAGMYEPCDWRDNDGKFWLYGGTGLNGMYSNLWMYDPDVDMWTWIKGPGSTLNQSAVYGTQGVPAPNNTPGARAYAISTWVDTTGNLWLLGGRDANNFNLSDMWMYNIATNEWAWMKGSSTVNLQGTYGTQGVSASTNLPGGRSETTATWTDTNNNLWLFGGYGADDVGTLGVLNDMWKFDVGTNNWTWIRGSKLCNDIGSFGTQGVADTSNNPPARMIFTRWKDHDGNFWIFGGGDWNYDYYWNDVWKYNPSTNLWTWISGPNFTGDDGTSGTQCEPDSNAVAHCRFENRCCWTDGCNGFWTFGGSTGGSLDQNWNDLWHFNFQTTEWTFVKGALFSNATGYYGTQGVSDIANVPPARGGGLSWIDNAGNLWMWGGINDFFIYYNDLWRYVIDPACPAVDLCFVPSIYASDTDICEKFCIDFADSSIGTTSWEWLFPGGVPSSSTLQNPANICYDNPGVYDVTLITTSAAGVDTIVLSNYITVYGTPPFPVITQTGYTLTSSAASTYQWQFNSVDIPGATNQSYDVQQTGHYSVYITDQYGCASSSTVYVLIEGIDNISADVNVEVYPNPSNGNFTVEWKDEKTGGYDVSLEIFNAVGQIVYSFEGSTFTGTGKSFKKEIGLGNKSSGVYLIQLRTDNFFARKKLVVLN